MWGMAPCCIIMLGWVGELGFGTKSRFHFIRSLLSRAGGLPCMYTYTNTLYCMTVVDIQRQAGMSVRGMW